MSFVKKLVVLSFTLLLIACGGGSNSDEEPEQKQITQQLVTENISSSITGITYQMDVYLPEDYDASGSAYDVIYSTDGQWRSDDYAKALQKNGAKVILIALHEGPKAQRGVDFLTPGVHDYYQFFTQELIPHVESNYNASIEQRTLVGHSYGGAMAFVFMLIDDIDNQYFSHYIAADPSVKDIDTLIAIEEDRYSQSTTLNATLILTGATEGGNAAGVELFHQYMLDKNYQGLTILHEAQEITHDESALATFQLMLKTLYPAQ